ncbi:MAG: choice-of-anchor K domain-containing protein [Alphaproteobacteria bacterium]
MEGFIRRFNLAVGGGALAAVLAVAQPTEAAVEVTIDNVDCSGTSAALENGGEAFGVGTATISWGALRPGNRSSYVFASEAPTGPIPLGETFTLGTFTPNNDPIILSSLEAATLQVDIEGTASNGSPKAFAVTSLFEFAHDETPNTGSGCCDDIVMTTMLVQPRRLKSVEKNSPSFIPAFWAIVRTSTPLTRPRGHPTRYPCRRRSGRCQRRCR